MSKLRRPVRDLSRCPRRRTISPLLIDRLWCRTRSSKNPKSWQNSLVSYDRVGDRPSLSRPCTITWPRSFAIRVRSFLLKVDRTSPRVMKNQFERVSHRTAMFRDGSNGSLTCCQKSKFRTHSRNEAPFSVSHGNLARFYSPPGKIPKQRFSPCNPYIHLAIRVGGDVAEWSKALPC